MMTLARNWGVLGRPKWTGRTILGALLIHAGILLGLVLTVLGVHFLLGWSFIWAFGIGNLVFWIAIRDLQTGAYAAWVTTRDPERMRRYGYRLKKKDCFIGLPLAVLLVVGATVFGWYESQPKRFENGHLSITYARTWDDQSQSKYDLCGDYETGCFLVLKGGRLDSAVIAFVESPVMDREWTLADAERQAWTNGWARVAGIRVLADDQMEIGGAPAVRREFEFPQTGGDPLYIHWFLVLHGQSYYEIIAWSPDKALHEDNRQKIMDVIHSITFKS
jgi:hypothetical protein